MGAPSHRRVAQLASASGKGRPIISALRGARSALPSMLASRAVLFVKKSAIWYYWIRLLLGNRYSSFTRNMDAATCDTVYSILSPNFAPIDAKELWAKLLSHYGNQPTPAFAALS